MFTETEASQKQCPFVAGKQCIASSCMAWQWAGRKTIERRIHTDTEEGKALNQARFGTGSSHYCPFDFEGHKWRYRCTDFDDNGAFDIIERPDFTSEQVGLCARLPSPFPENDF